MGNAAALPLPAVQEGTMPDRHLKSTLDRIARGVETLVAKLGAKPGFSSEKTTWTFKPGVAYWSPPPLSGHSYRNPTFWQSYLAAADRAKEAGTILQSTRDEARIRLKDVGWEQDHEGVIDCSGCYHRWLDPITNGRFFFDDAARLQAERSGG